VKQYRAIIFYTLLFSIILFVLGQIFYGIFFELAVPKVEGAFYRVVEFNNPFRASILFSFILALVPLFILLTWRLASIAVLNKKLLTIFIAVICMASAVFIRQVMIRSYLKALTKSVNNHAQQLQVNYPVDQLYFEYCMFGGLCIGCLLSYFLFRAKQI